MVYLIVQQLSKARVRLPNGKLTPAFAIGDEAFTYADNHNIQHCRIIKVKDQQQEPQQGLENFI